MSKDEVLAWLEQRGTRRTVEGMARYGIVVGSVDQVLALALERPELALAA